eukprot:Filipodium_phascolosomae@DN2414_c0_g1_i7.p1
MTDWQNGDELYASASHKLHRCLYYGMGLRTVGHNVCAPQSWLCQTEGLRLQKLGNTLESLLFPLQPADQSVQELAFRGEAYCFNLRGSQGAISSHIEKWLRRFMWMDPLCWIL